jgi:hypothetical protein
MCSFEVKLDIESDAWNWWDACNRISHGVDWKKRIDQNVAENLVGKSEKAASDFLIPFLKEKYKEEKNTLRASNNYINKEYSDKLGSACKKLVAAMGKPLYRDDFTFYLTTFPREPYDKDHGYIFQCLYWSDPVQTFLHELCHFQFIHYWRENPKSSVSKLADHDFEFLKESLTIILDNNFIPIVQKPDKGYKIHQELRKELTTFLK